MPLLNVTLIAGLSNETKNALRRQLSSDIVALIGTDTKNVTVLFHELLPGIISESELLAEIYLSGDRPIAFEEIQARFVAKDICRCTSWPDNKVNVLIHDIRNGSVAIGGKILYRNGVASEEIVI